MSHSTNTEQRTNDAFDQFKRYGNGVETDELATALETLTDINDDVANDRHPSCVKELVERAKAELDAVYQDYLTSREKRDGCSYPYVPEKSEQSTSSEQVEHPFIVSLMKDFYPSVTPVESMEEAEKTFAELYDENAASGPYAVHEVVLYIAQVCKQVKFMGDY